MDIDKALIAREALRGIAQRFAVSDDALQRHKKHIARAITKAEDKRNKTIVTVAKAYERAEERRADTLVDQLRALITEAQEIGAEARRSKKLAVAMAGIEKQARVLELIARLTGQLDDGNRVSILIQQRAEREAEAAQDLRRLSIEERITLQGLLEKARSDGCAQDAIDVRATPVAAIGARA
jgi:hypothetical protein